MKIQHIQSQTNTFKKSRFIPISMADDLYNLVKKMRSETRTVEHGNYVRTVSVRGVQVQKEGTIKDGKFLAKRDELGELVPYGENFTMIEMGKSRLIIDNRSDSIVDYKKPFLMTWKDLLRQASSLVVESLNNYSNSDLVKKILITKERLSKAGVEQAQKELKPLMNFVERMTRCYK